MSVNPGSGVTKSQVYRTVREEETRTVTTKTSTSTPKTAAPTYQSKSFIQIQKNQSASKQKEEEEEEEEETETETESESESEDEAVATPPGVRKPALPAAQQKQPIAAHGPTQARGGVRPQQQQVQTPQQQQQPPQQQPQQHPRKTFDPNQFYQQTPRPNKQFLASVNANEADRLLYEQEQLRQQNLRSESTQSAVSPNCTPTLFRKPLWPPSDNRQYLPTSTQSIHWATAKGSTKFVWPPPRQYTSYDYETYEQDGPVKSVEAEQKAREFMSQSVAPGPRRVNPRSPGRLAAEAWQPYVEKYRDDSFDPCSVNRRPTKRFEDVITCSNATRLPPTYRTPPGTQHVILSC